ncbi:SDR family NAD(P)-dependent oxidoreductase [Kitasatospora indigofera]|uniref:SDR family NAD(P)-dependent oxidoreductase n=1 Tax=Kitasatospora indigofera TaxID=67307 RepID=UPI0033AFC6E4
MTLISTELSLAVRPLQGRTALVTGAATGIGAATARALAAAGATIAIAHPTRSTSPAASSTLCAAPERTASRSVPTSPTPTPPP